MKIKFLFTIFAVIAIVSCHDTDEHKTVICIPVYGQSLALGVDAEGRLGFFTKAEGTYMDANTAWLSTENLAMKDVTAIYLVEATAPVIMLGDADGDGVVSIKDVSFLIDYLLNGLPSKDETVGVLNFTGADVNRDGDVNIKDLSILIDQLLTTER